MTIELKNMLAKIAEQTLLRSFQFSDRERLDKEDKRWYVWDWSIGVGFCGLWQAYDHLRKNEYAISMKKWIDERLDRNGIGSICVNTNALLLSVLRLRELRDEEKYEPLCQAFDSYLMRQAPRTPSGTVAHTVIQQAYDGEVWADTLFMSMVYLAKRGMLLNDDGRWQEAVNQLALHMKLLADRQTGLFYHGWDDVSKQPLGVKWGRGNAWIIVSAIEILETVPSDIPEKTAIVQALHAQIDALAILQDESGLWRTVLDRSDTYLESSVTAGVAYGILKGIRLGMIDERYRTVADKAVLGLTRQIDDQGNVLKGSTGTPIKADAMEYNLIPYRVTPFTQGLAMMALSEYLHWKG